MQQKLVISGRQHVDADEILGDRQRAHELRAVDEHDCAHRPGQRADRADVGTMARCALHCAERNQYGPRVDVTRDVVDFQSTVAERHLANLIPFGSEQPPREMVRAVLALADDNVLPALGRGELRSDEAGSCGHRRDQGDIGRVCSDQRRNRDPSALSCGLTGDVVERARVHSSM